MEIVFLKPVARLEQGSLHKKGLAPSLNQTLFARQEEDGH